MMIKIMIDDFELEKLLDIPIEQIVQRSFLNSFHRISESTYHAP